MLNLGKECRIKTCLIWNSIRGRCASKPRFACVHEEVLVSAVCFEEQVVPYNNARQNSICSLRSKDCAEGRGAADSLRRGEGATHSERDIRSAHWHFSKMAEISTEDAVDQLHQMFGDYDKATLAAVLEVCCCLAYIPVVQPCFY